MSTDTQNSRNQGDNKRRRSRGGQKRRNNSNNSERRSDGRQSGGGRRDGGNRSEGGQKSGKSFRRPMPAPIELSWWQKLLKAVGLYKEPVRPPRPERRPDAAASGKTREPRKTKTRDARSDSSKGQRTNATPPLRSPHRAAEAKAVATATGTALVVATPPPWRTVACM